MGRRSWSVVVSTLIRHSRECGRMYLITKTAHARTAGLLVDFETIVRSVCCIGGARRWQRTCICNPNPPRPWKVWSIAERECGDQSEAPWEGELHQVAMAHVLAGGEEAHAGLGGIVDRKRMAGEAVGAIVEHVGGVVDAVEAVGDDVAVGDAGGRVDDENAADVEMEAAAAAAGVKSEDAVEEHEGEAVGVGVGVADMHAWMVRPMSSPTKQHPTRACAATYRCDDMQSSSRAS